MQHALLIESPTEAMRECVTALGGPKVVGPRMQPELPAEQAANWVRDRCNPNRRELFNPDQVMWLLREARKAGFHGGMQYFAEQAGYATPVPVEPEDEIARLQRQFIRSVEEQKALADRMARMMGEKP